MESSIGPSYAHALHLARRVLHIGLHQPLDGLADGHHRPGALGVVVHEDVVALLRVLPQVEDLGHDGDIFLGALPAEVGVHGQAAGRLPIVAAQVEHGLVVADAGCAGGQLVLGEVEPAIRAPTCRCRTGPATCRSCRR